MTTTPNVASITKAVETALVNRQGLADFTVERGEPVNKDPSQCPWVGVYRRQQMFEPRTLGAGSGHREFKGTLLLIVQETSLESGADCEDLLDLAVSDVVATVLDDTGLRDTVDMVNEIEVAYSYDAATDEDDEEGQWFQSAYVQITLQARTT